MNKSVHGSTSRRWVLGSLAAATALVLSACGGSSGSGSSNQAGGSSSTDFGTITVAFSAPQGLIYLPAQLGPDLGVYKKCGLDVKNITASSSTVGPALASGQVDLYLASGTRAVSSIMSGLEGKMVAGESKWDFIFIVSQKLKSQGVDSADGFKNISPSDLPLKIGVSSIGSGGWVSAVKLADKLGWTEGKQYKFVTLGDITALSAGLQSGSIDAFAWASDAGYEAQVKGVGYVIPNVVEDAVGPALGEAYVASNKTIQDRPKALKAYMKCTFDYLAKLKKDPKQVANLAATHWGLDPKAMSLAAPSTVDWWILDGKATQEQLQNTADVAISTSDGKVTSAPIDKWWQYWGDIK